MKLVGRLRLGEPVEKLDKALDELYDRGERRIILDLEEVPNIDSSGIGALVRALTATKQNSIRFKLLKPSKMVLQTLKLVALLPLFEVYEDLATAMESFE